MPYDQKARFWNVNGRLVETKNLVSSYGEYFLFVYLQVVLFVIVIVN